MKIKKIYEENWIGVTNGGKEYDCENINQVKTAIKNLNGNNKTMIELIVNEKLFLTIAGGNQGRYICYLTNENHIYNLVNLTKADGKQIEIVTGGQLGLYESKICLNINNIIKAADFFCDNADMNPNQHWEKDF